GLEILTWLTRQPEWKALPVVVLTTSFHGAYIQKAYELGANSFLTKPTDFRESVAAIRLMCDFWLLDASLPILGPTSPPPPPAGGKGPSGQTIQWPGFVHGGGSGPSALMEAA